jgi:hypothetical protein
VVFGIAHDGNTPAAGKHYIAFRHTLRGIVSAFGVNVRTQQANQFGDIGRVKDDNRIHVTERRQKLGTFIAWHAWPAFSLERARAGVRINGDDQPATQLLGGAQVTDMPDMKKIKASVGQDDLVSSRAPLLDLGRQLSGRKYFLYGPGQSALHDSAKKFSASYGGGAAFHHHNASSIVGQTRRGFWIGPGSQRSGVGGNNGIACSSHVGNFVRAVNRYNHRFGAA